MAYIPNDPLFARQWHLQNNTPGLFDLNIVDVWDDYTGAGIDVAVIDDGLQLRHPDLNGNYSIVKDWDFFNNDNNPNGTNRDSHGTSVAGIVSANEGNGIGGVGVAYDSTLFGFQTVPLIGNGFVQQLANAIDNASGRRRQASVNREADVVNMSLGTMYDQNYFDQTLSSFDMASLNAAINNAATSGRNGLGTILVKSAGNSRAINHDTNSSSWNANPRTISVAAVNQDGVVSNYSTHGASLLVSAFGSPGQVVTTDRIGIDGYSSGDYTFGFNGTSAAAPMVSGVVALMLEANPDLDWRDVQEILAYSARHVGSEVGSSTIGSEEYTWAFNGTNDWNGGGLHFSNDYGFGLVDAKAAVRLAESWGREPKVGFDTLTANVDFVNTSTTLQQNGTTLMRDVRANVEVEHVEVDVSFTQWHDLGDLKVYLISPSGTSSILIQNTGENDGTADGGFVSGRWKFYSNAFRGENSLGNWTLQLFDQDNTIVSPITVDDIDVRLMGGIDKFEDNFIFTEEFSEYAGTFGHTKALDGGRGIDTVNAVAVDSKTSINLAARQGIIDGVDVTLAGMENVFTGDGDDVVIGNTAANKLAGMRGNDYLDGGIGNDTLIGGQGDDQFVVDSALDKVVEKNNEGIDTAYAVVNYTLADNVENMTLRNQVAEGRGNRSDNTIRGNNVQNLIEGLDGEDHLYGFEGDDTLKGGNDNDWLVGGGGDDTMYGGLGDDGFTVYSALDKTIEFANEGTDTVYTYVDYTLADNVENMTLRDPVYYGRGNNEENIIRGNSNRNLIEGLGGNDELHGYYGNDTLNGGDGDDYLNGGYDNDELIGGSGVDKLAGNNGDDVLTGGVGDDRLLGGMGADTFIFEAATDGLDLITDFSRLQNDVLKILSSGFSGSLKKGWLDSSQFVLGRTSTTADSRFLYHRPSGSLHFDADGTGAAAATQIATFSNSAELSHSNVLIA